jgi:hypothetical protein
VVVSLRASAPLSQKPQLVDDTFVSSACSLGDRFSAFMASASSGGVWPVTEYRRCVTMLPVLGVNAVFGSAMRGGVDDTWRCRRVPANIVAVCWQAAQGTALGLDASIGEAASCGVS